MHPSLDAISGLSTLVRMQHQCHHIPGSCRCRSSKEPASANPHPSGATGEQK